MSKTSEQKTCVPKRRFPEFWDAGAWDYPVLEKVYTFKVTNSFSREKLNYEKGTVKNIHYGDIHTKFSTLFDITKEKVPFINPDQEIGNIKQENYCLEGDVIFADASEDMDDIGKSIEIVNLNNEKLLAGLHTLLARQIKPRLVTGFAGYLFKSRNVRIQIQKEAQGAKVLGISAGRLSNIKLPIPHITEEQQKIADCLSSIDDLITAQGKKVEALKDHKKGLMQQLFPAEGQTRPATRFPEFQDAGDWEEKPLGKIAKVLQGSGFPTQYQGNINAEYPFYKVSDISNSIQKGENHIKEAANYIDEAIREKLKAKLIPVGTTIFAKIGEAIRLNRRVMTTEPCLIDNNVAGLKRIKSETIDLFIYYTMLRIDLADHCGGAVPSINKTTLENILIVCPEIPEQERIADCLSSIDDLITAHTKKLDALKDHKKGLMQQLFPSADDMD